MYCLVTSKAEYSSEKAINWNPNLTNGDEEPHSFERRFGVNDLTIYVFTHSNTSLKLFFTNISRVRLFWRCIFSMLLVLLFGYHVFNQQNDSKEYFKV